MNDHLDEGACEYCEGTGEETSLEYDSPACRVCQGTGERPPGDTETTRTAFLVIESTPGYLPDADEPGEFDEYADAVTYVDQLADELEERGYTADRSWASQDNLYAVHAEQSDTVRADLGRTIQVIHTHE